MPDKRGLVISGLRLTVAEVFAATEAKIARGETFSAGEVEELLGIAEAIDVATEKRVDKVRWHSSLQMCADLSSSKNEAARRIAEAYEIDPESLRRSMQPSRRGVDEKGIFRHYPRR